MRETKFRNNYLGRKINEEIKALLNEMSVTTDNTHEEDVTLPEILDRITSRVNDVTGKLEKTVQDVEIIKENSGSGATASNVKFYKSISKFPSPDQAQINVLYIDTTNYMMYLWDVESMTYSPVQFKITLENITAEDLNELIQVIHGGTATTVL
jgi:hypothetical protein